MMRFELTTLTLATWCSTTELHPHLVQDNTIQALPDFFQTGSAFFAPGLAVIEMAESILKDQKKVLPCAALLEGEYGIKGIFAGVPVKLGKMGVEEVVELDLSKKEREAFEKSVKHIKSLIEKLWKLIPIFICDTPIN